MTETVKTIEIPHASEIKKQEDGKQADQREPRELTDEEKKEREDMRTGMVRQCRDYVHSYIEKKAPGKIRYRANVLNMNNSYIFRFAPPAKRGQRTRFFSQVVIDKDTNECRLEYFRPRRHEQNLWYFPIYYMMNGFTKNSERTFQALGVEPVNDSIRAVFESKGYQVSFIYNRQIGNVVCVEWDVEDKPTTNQAEAEPQEAEAEPQEAEAEPQETNQAEAEPQEAEPQETNQAEAEPQEAEAPAKVEINPDVELEPEDGVPIM